jgi:hypothetical protein
MNEEDKKRFARYKKGYVISSKEEEEFLSNYNNNNSNKQDKDILKQKQVLGYINSVSVNPDALINNITNKNK